MDELVKLICEKLGIDASTANSAIAKIMSVIKENVGDDLFSKISGAIPGAEESAAQGIAETGSAPSENGGLFGKLASMASSALGGKAGEGLELGAALSAMGISTEKLGPLVETIVEFLKSKLGDDAVDQIVAKFPMLKTFIS